MVRNDKEQIQVGKMRRLYQKEKDRQSKILADQYKELIELTFRIAEKEGGDSK